MNVSKTSIAQQRVSRTDSTTTILYLVLSKDEIKTKMKIMHNELSKIKKQRDRFLHKVETLIETRYVSLNPVDNDDVEKIILKDSTLLERKNLTMF